MDFVKSDTIRENTVATNRGILKDRKKDLKLDILDYKMLAVSG